MTELPLHGFHQRWNAHFADINGHEVVDHYGDPLAEHAALSETAGLLDLSFRGRLSLTGPDRKRFLHGQVTNNVKQLEPGAGCYAALVTAKGRMQSDLNIHCLAEKLLLDFEPGLSGTIAERLERYIIADDVQCIDVATRHGLLSVQGPKAAEVIRGLGTTRPLPSQPLGSVSWPDSDLGDVHCMHQPRGLAEGYDLFVPVASLAATAERLAASARQLGGRPCGWQALELARVEAGRPRYGADMDEQNLPPEAGIEERAVSYTKGCYIGQEVIARIRTYGQVARSLRGLLLPDGLRELPGRGDKLFLGDKEVGCITSAIKSPRFQRAIALGYVRRECNQPGSVLQLRLGGAEWAVTTTTLPFTLDNTPSSPA